MRRKVSENLTDNETTLNSGRRSYLLEQPGNSLKAISSASANSKLIWNCVIRKLTLAWVLWETRWETS